MFLNFDNTYERLPESFWSKARPEVFSSPKLLHISHTLARELGIDPEELRSDTGLKILAGQEIPPGASSIAMVYAGHQFGHFSPQLGDGRAILMGEVMDRSGKRRDLQWKGSGPTAYSRRGDGLSALGPAIREFLVSEAMYALGVPTTRTLAVMATGDSVVREQDQPGGLSIRVAQSHIRVGTFEYFAARGDFANLRILADYTIQRHDPQLSSEKEPYLEFLRHVMERQAELVAHWMRLGFIHGVMNTDNVSISGETIDFGPCAFMDSYDENKVFSAIDRGGRYRYAMQPYIAQWNMARLAEALLPLIDSHIQVAIDKVTPLIEGFKDLYEQYWLGMMSKKIGLIHQHPEDRALVEKLLGIFMAHGTDFTRGFREIYHLYRNDLLLMDDEEKILPQDSEMQAWWQAWHKRLSLESGDRQEQLRVMKKNCPAVIPRNHLVERAIMEASQKGESALLKELHKRWQAPYEDLESPREKFYTSPPTPDEEVRQTFCGT